MNVESLRGNKDAAAQSAEIRIAKVAIGILCLYLLSWTPYAIVALIAAFGNRYLSEISILKPQDICRIFYLRISINYAKVFVRHQVVFVHSDSP